MGLSPPLLPTSQPWDPGGTQAGSWAGAKRIFHESRHLGPASLGRRLEVPSGAELLPGPPQAASWVVHFIYRGLLPLLRPCPQAWHHSPWNKGDLRTELPEPPSGNTARARTAPVPSWWEPSPVQAREQLWTGNTGFHAISRTSLHSNHVQEKPSSAIWGWTPAPSPPLPAALTRSVPLAGRVPSGSPRSVRSPARSQGYPEPPERVVGRGAHTW